MFCAYISLLCSVLPFYIALQLPVVFRRGTVLARVRDLMAIRVDALGIANVVSARIAAPVNGDSDSTSTALRPSGNIGGTVDDAGVSHRRGSSSAVSGTPSVHAHASFTSRRALKGTPSQPQLGGSGSSEAAATSAAALAAQHQQQPQPQLSFEQTHTLFSSSMQPLAISLEVSSTSSPTIIGPNSSSSSSSSGTPLLKSLRVITPGTTGISSSRNHSGFSSSGSSSSHCLITSGTASAISHNANINNTGSSNSSSSNSILLGVNGSDDAAPSLPISWAPVEIAVDSSSSSDEKSKGAGNGHKRSSSGSSAASKSSNGSGSGSAAPKSLAPLPTAALLTTDVPFYSGRGRDSSTWGTSTPHPDVRPVQLPSGVGMVFPDFMKSAFLSLFFAADGNRG